jgi:lysophospholipase L1-like esterase
MKSLLRWWKSGLVVVLIALVSSVAFAQSGGVDTTLVMAVGDSFVAGFQNGGLSINGQRNGFASLVARQIGAFLPLPTITQPGIPPVFTIAPAPPFPRISATPGTPLTPLNGGNVFHFDLAVPGATVHQVLADRPQPVDPVNRPNDVLRDFILGVPGISVPGTVPAGSQIEQVEALHPTFVIAWFGGNDVLGAVGANSVSLITPFAQFSSDYLAAMKRIQAAGAKVVTANVPDVTISPGLVPAQAIAAQAGLPLSVIGPVLGISAGDYVYLQVVPLVSQILTGQIPGPLPLSGILKAADAATIRAALQQENDFIKSTAASLGIPMADFYATINNIAANGIVVGGRKLGLGILGGIVGLDFIHPTNTGYAVLANELIKAINGGYGANYPLLDLNAVFASDPLGVYVHKRADEGVDGSDISIFDVSIDPDAYQGFLNFIIRPDSTVDGQATTPTEEREKPEHKRITRAR